MAKVIVRLPPNAVVRCGVIGGSRTAPPITVRSLGRHLAGWRNPHTDRSGRARFFLLQLPGDSFGMISFEPPPGVIPTRPGLEVLYEGVIPPKWIVKILAEKDTDEKVRRYRRRPRRSEDEP